jgi:hypothetical protein
MAYLLITDFIAGLDTRKSRFTAAPGSLRVARNVHLTRGGEVEVRKKFVPVYTLPAGQTCGVATVRGQIYVFGSVPNVVTPAGVIYQYLASPTGAYLSKILSTDNFDGKIYVVAEFGDGSIYHYFDGVRVTDWDAIAASVGSNQTIATALAAKLDAMDGISAIATGTSAVVTADVPGVAFTYGSASYNHGANPDDSLSPTLNQAAVAGVAAKQATATITVTGGTEAQGVNQIRSIKVNNVELLTVPVDWRSANGTTATAIAQQINSQLTLPNYSALASGANVIITSDTAGAGPNAFPVASVVAGNVTLSTPATMSGGVTPVTGMSQVVTFTVGGTFEVPDLFQVNINGAVISVQAGASGTATFVRTLGDKMYAVAQSLMYFSGFTGDPPRPDPTQWDTGTTGAGFVNMSTQDGGSSQLTGLAVYQNKMAVLSRRNTQIWSVDADEAQNAQIQVLINIGTNSPKTLSAFGEQDVFFLSESGIRSLRARDSSNLASADDVGSSIDGEVLEYTHALDETLVRDAVATTEPFEGRYLLAVGPTIYVFSHFPGSKVSAWTTYVLEELGDTDGSRTVTDLAVSHRSIIARVGDRLCLYGGQTGQEYAANEEFEYEVQLPFLDAGQPGQTKNLEAVDTGAEGFWSVFLALDPQQPEVTELVGILEDSTYGSWGRCVVVGQSTHFSLTLKSRARGYARLANLMIHFSGQGEKS